ncbi:MAG: hypothetical protein AAFQ85_05320 [Pseudomonadota bacterium]
MPLRLIRILVIVVALSVLLWLFVPASFYTGTMLAVLIATLIYFVGALRGRGW